MSMTTISQLTARIKFSVDNTGLKEVNTGLDKFKKSTKQATKQTKSLTEKIGDLSKAVFKLELGFLGAVTGLSKLVIEQGRSATQAQIQSNFFDIQIGKLMGLRDAYKAVGGSMATSLGATKNFQDIQSGMLMGNVPIEKLKALGVAGAPDLIRELLTGNQAKFQSDLFRQYNKLLKGNAQQRKQAFVLRNAFPEMIKDSAQQAVLSRAAGGKSLGQITQRQNELRFGSSDPKKIRERQYLAQRQGFEFANIGLGIKGNFMAMGRGFAKSFSLKDMQKFQDTLIKFQEVSEKIGKAVGKMAKGFMSGMNDMLTQFQKFSDFLDKHGIDMSNTLEMIGKALAYAFPLSIVGIITKLVTKMLKLSGILKGIKSTAGAIGAMSGLNKATGMGGISGEAIKDVKGAGKGAGKEVGLMGKLLRGVTNAITAGFGAAIGAMGTGWSFMKNAGKPLNIGKSFLGAQTGILGSAQAPSMMTQIMPMLVNLLRASTGLAALLYSPKAGDATLSGLFTPEQLKQMQLGKGGSGTTNNTSNSNTTVHNTFNQVTPNQMDQLTTLNNNRNNNSNRRAN